MRLLAAASALAALLGLAVAAHVWPQEIAAPIAAAMQRAQAWSRRSWPLFLLIQTLVALSGIVPASLVGLAAGAVYGPLLGFAMAAISTLAAAGLAFALARSALRGAIVALVARRPVLARLDRAVSRDGWRMVCLLRVSPVMPFALTSYALGLTGLTLRHYILGTLAALPALAGYVLLGWLGGIGASSAGEHGSSLKWTLLGIGCVATVMLIWRVGVLLRQALHVDAPMDAEPRFLEL